MDWILFSAIMTLVFLYLTISYDISCQWKLNLPDRLSHLPPHMQQDLNAKVVQFGLPVWHAESHTPNCRDNNHLRYRRGVGKTDGEGIERLWAVLNPAALATKEMGLGNRADVLDDRIDNHNFIKNMTLGAFLLLRSLSLAVDDIQSSRYNVDS
jgi:hypothetical protein